MKKLLFCMGTRPEAIKLAPLVLAAQSRGFPVKVLVSGQHRDMIGPFLDFFGLRPDYTLDVLKPNQSLSELTANLLSKIQGAVNDARPDLVFVQGDTTTAMTGALAAFYEKIPVAHIEAGLRTHDRYSPFPEEMNRKLITALTTYFFAPTTLAAENLAREGIRENVWVTGNTGVDALRITADRLGGAAEDDPAHTMANQQILVTCHRRENHGEPLERILRAVLKILDQHPKARVVFPVHLNPNVQKSVQGALGNHPRVKLTPPLDYLAFVQAMKESSVLLTDSGGVQEEAPYLKKPIFVMRESTERPEGIDAGVAVLVGADESKIVSLVGNALTDKAYRDSFIHRVSPYGDGFASEKILDHLSRI